VDITSTSITTRHNADARRYELLDDDNVIGKAYYVPFDAADGPERIFFHTVVDEAYGGQGLASRLASFALEDTVATATKIVPVCPYIKAFLRKHDEFAPDVVAVTPAHLAALPHR
jgi:predicted GNAT family acetyltransferase